MQNIRKTLEIKSKKPIVYKWTADGMPPVSPGLKLRLRVTLVFYDRARNKTQGNKKLKTTLSNASFAWTHDSSTPTPRPYSQCCRWEFSTRTRFWVKMYQNEPISYHMGYANVPSYVPLYKIHQNVIDEQDSTSIPVNSCVWCSYLDICDICCPYPLHNMICFNRIDVT